MYRSLLVTSLAAVLLTTGANCERAQFRIIVENGERVLEWYCPPERVLFLYNEAHWCFEKCADCPNGYCHENECNCFPGMRRDQAGVCGKICKDCENGWCSSVSKCECNEGFTSSQGRCVRQNRYQSNMLSKEVQGHSSIGLSSQSASELSSKLVIPWIQAPQFVKTHHTHPLWSPISISHYFTHNRPLSFHPYAPLDGRYLPQCPLHQSLLYYPQHFIPISLQHPQTYPNYPPLELPVYPQPNPENPSQTLPQSTPQLNPQPPSKLPSELSSGFNPSPAGRPNPSYPSSEGHPQPQSCQPDYLWDPKMEACVPYESAKPPKIDPRTDYLTRT